MTRERCFAMLRVAALCAAAPCAAIPCAGCTPCEARPAIREPHDLADDLGYALRLQRHGECFANGVRLDRCPGDIEGGPRVAFEHDIRCEPAIRVSSNEYRCAGELGMIAYEVSYLEADWGGALAAAAFVSCCPDGAGEWAVLPSPVALTALGERELGAIAVARAALVPRDEPTELVLTFVEGAECRSSVAVEWDGQAFRLSRPRTLRVRDEACVYPSDAVSRFCDPREPTDHCAIDDSLALEGRPTRR